MKFLVKKKVTPVLHFERLRFHRTHLLELSIDMRTVKFAEQWKITADNGNKIIR